MYTVRFGGKKGKTTSFAVSEDHIVVRTVRRSPLTPDRPFEATPLSRSSRAAISDFTCVVSFPSAGVEVLQAVVPRAKRAARDRARSALKKEPTIEFAGRALVDPRSRRPVVYTENLFVKFDDDASASARRALLKKHKLEVKRQLTYAANAFFIGAPEGTGLDVFALAEKVLANPIVELCHPELIRESRVRGAFAQQWHLRKTTIGGVSVDAHASVEAAWALSDGTGTTIAIIDDGVDTGHEEFMVTGKIVAPRDVTRGTDDPSPGNRNNHGTACAGVACASGTFGASGVAPRARLMPIRMMSALGSQNEADSFAWAADHGADVISCSWGPEDGDPEDPNDPLHNQVTPLPDSTRLAIDYAATQGRGGKGCVILFAAGNGNESVDNDGYASYKRVIAVAACNDSGKRSAYSDFGAATWCAFPSNDILPAKTPGIWTTDRSGKDGYNPGIGTLGDVAGNYTNDFGGTSSAAPGAAGVAALVLARNPNLRADEVRDILRRSCDRIDPAGGKYDATGRSALYGFGRLNARTAVQLAAPGGQTLVQIRSALGNVPIKDLSTARLTLPVADAKPLQSLKVRVDIDHTYIGDLVVTLKGPTGIGVPKVVLHNREGGSRNSIRKEYDTVNAPALSGFIGKSPAGTWTLEVADKERADTGTLRGLTLELEM
jgi:subtilisin family serine protease